MANLHLRSPREHSIHPSLPSRWRDELADNPEKAFSGNGNKYKDPARIAELERLLGQAHAEIELLKKSLRHDPEEGSGGENKTNAEGRYMTIHEVLSDGSALSVSHSCQALEVSRSGYYKWRIQPEISPADSEDLDLKNQIQEIAMEFTGYGYRRMTAELQNRGFEVNRKRVLRLMQQESLLCKKKRFKPVTTDSSHGLPVYPNLLKNAEINGLNQVWASDITYVQLLHEHIYLAVILDLYSRKCIGWELSRNIDSQLAMNALDRAIENRWSESTQGLVHHSDQGFQYASHDYVDCLKEHSILISMSRKGNPYDNAFAESFIKTLKVEEVYLNEYGTFEDAYSNIWRFIEKVYNKKRLHSSLGYRSPEQFEVEVALNTVA